MRFFNKKNNDEVGVNNSQPAPTPTNQIMNSPIDPVLQNIPSEMVQLSNAEYPVKVLTPVSYMTTIDIAQLLLALKYVTVDFGQLEAGERLRAIDFLSGVVYGHHGEVQRLEKKIYVFRLNPTHHASAVQG